METSETPQTSSIFTDESQFSQRGSLASPHLLPGSEKAQEMTVGSGRQLSMLLSESSPLGVFSRTLLASSAWSNSEEYCYVWQILDTRFGLSAFQLTPLGQSTDDSGCLLWRTPNASIVTGGGQDGEKRLAAGHAMQLSDQVLTPMLWPTPTARDWKSTSHGNQGNSRPLSEVAGLEGSGSLNPRFVEEMMGFEVGHTDLRHWETLSSRNKRTPYLKQSEKP
jgi:hypothetical protein